jgi:2,3-dihydroxybenzoate---[aryl-carrier protein] ligase
MLEGVVPFPAEFAARYRQSGYWEDRPLRDVFAQVCSQHSERIAVIDGEHAFTYAELDAHATNLALNLLALGLKPLDRVVVLLPNVVEFVFLHLALQKLGCIPIMALPSHRYREIKQFVRLSGAVACVTPASLKDVDFTVLFRRVQAESETLRLGIVLGDAGPDFYALRDLIDRPATLLPAVLEQITIDPTDPALFLLSGGTTGIPKLIPRTHNDYAFNSKTAVSVCDVHADDALLLVLPIGHNLPLACPGLQGFLLRGAKVIMSTRTRAADVFSLVARHHITHIHVVPALLIRWINDPIVERYDLRSLRVIQSGGQRLQPNVRLHTERVLGCMVQENFGMAEGMLMFVRLDDPADVRLETVGRPICPDDEVRIVDEDDQEVSPGEVGELLARGPYTLRGYYGVPEYNARAFTFDGFYRSGDLMRLHPSGNYMVEGRKKDLINRGGEKISAEEIENLILAHPAVLNVACIPLPHAILGEQMCACIIPQPGASITFEELIMFLTNEEIARHKLPECMEIMEQFPLSTFGKVSKKDLVALVTSKYQNRV